MCIYIAICMYAAIHVLDNADIIFWILSQVI